MQRLPDFENFREFYFELDGEPSSAEQLASTWKDAGKDFSSCAQSLRNIDLSGYQDTNGVQLRQRVNVHASKMVEFFTEATDRTAEALDKYATLLTISKDTMGDYKKEAIRLHGLVNTTVDNYEEEERNLAAAEARIDAVSAGVHVSNLATLRSNYDTHRDQWSDNLLDAEEFKNSTHVDAAVALGQPLRDADRKVGDYEVTGTSDNNDSDVDHQQLAEAAEKVVNSARALLDIAKELSSDFTQDTTNGGMQFRSDVVNYRTILHFTAGRVWHEMNELASRMAHVAELYKNTEDTNTVAFDREVSEALAKRLPFEGNQLVPAGGIAVVEEIAEKLGGPLGAVGKLFTTGAKFMSSPTLDMFYNAERQIANGEDRTSAYIEAYVEREAEMGGELAGNIPLFGLPAEILATGVVDELTPQL